MAGFGFHGALRLSDPDLPAAALRRQGAQAALDPDRAVTGARIQAACEIPSAHLAAARPQMSLAGIRHLDRAVTRGSLDRLLHTDQPDIPAARFRLHRARALLNPDGAVPSVSFQPTRDATTPDIAAAGVQVGRADLAHLDRAVAGARFEGTA